MGRLRRDRVSTAAWAPGVACPASLDGVEWPRMNYKVAMHQPRSGREAPWRSDSPQRACRFRAQIRFCHEVGYS